MVGERRKFLYGPTRKTANHEVQELMMEENVFPKDLSEKQNKWETTNSTHFRRKYVKLDRETAKLSTEIQRTSNFKFGRDENYPLITTKISEFGKNLLPPVKPVVCDYYSTNIPDFSPSCAKSKMVADGGSVYISSYLTPKTCPKALGKSREHLKSQTEDMRSTHFHFGCQKQRKCSETVHSYNGGNYVNEPHENNEPRVVGTSSVFRHGDWNMASRADGTHTSSVSHDHFVDTKDKMVPFSTKNCSDKIVEKSDSSGACDDLRHSAHFNLVGQGCDKYLVSSLYKKDFRQFAPPQYPLETLKAVRPKSAKVLNQTSDMVCPISTEQSDFVYRQNQAEDFLKKRSLEYEKNQGQNKMSCVVLDDCGNDNTKYIKPVSMSKKDYRLPQIEALRQHKIARRPTPMYDYILLDQGLPEKCQITKDTGKALTSSDRDARGTHGQRREERIRDNHQTHFTFGTDTERYPNSEQHDQFVGKAPLDPAYPSAGKSSKKTYSSRDEATPTAFPQLSVMRADYQATSKVSSAQRRLINLSSKHQKFLAPTHYFHMDHEGGKKISTTATDYAPPELMTV